MGSSFRMRWAEVCRVLPADGPLVRDLKASLALPLLAGGAADLGAESGRVSLRLVPEPFDLVGEDADRGLEHADGVVEVGDLLGDRPVARGELASEVGLEVERAERRHGLTVSRLLACVKRAVR